MQSAKNNVQKNMIASSSIANETSAVEQSHVAQLIVPSLQKPRTVSSWKLWLEAFQAVFPIYLATRIAFLLLTYLSTLFFFDNFSDHTRKLTDLLKQWSRWDTSQFTSIAQSGYTNPSTAAFFPLYPMLEALLTPIFHKPFYAGLVISNLATLGLFMVLYRIVRIETNKKQAVRTVLFLAVFPTAFFLAAAYNESLFLFLALFCFYHMRRGSWWSAGAFGLLASLTRSAGVFLLLPFLYEYLRQHEFKLQRIRFNIVAGALIPIGLVLFALYCYYKLHDILAFLHAQVSWHRQLSLPWYGFTSAITNIQDHAILSFNSIHNVIDLSAGLVMLALITLCFVGPWKFSRDRLVYALYGLVFYLFLILFPAMGDSPLQSLSRLVLELFPAFMILGAMGRRLAFNIYYLTISISLLAFMLLQFLMGLWIV